jgi:hypothetical protein
MYKDYLETSLDTVYIVKILRRDCRQIQGIFSNYYEYDNGVGSPNEYEINYDWIEGNKNLFEEFNSDAHKEKWKKERVYYNLLSKTEKLKYNDPDELEELLKEKYKAFEPFDKVYPREDERYIENDDLFVDENNELKLKFQYQKNKERLEFYKEEYKLHKLQNYFNERDNLKELYESQKIKYDDYDKQLYNLQYKYFETVNTIIGDSVRYYLKSINN